MDPLPDSEMQMALGAPAPPRGWRRVLDGARRSEYVAGVAKLASGAALAQAVGIGTMPVITRLYAPADYGVYASFLALVGIFGPAAALRYDFSIVLPETDEEAASAVGLCLALAAVVVAAMSVVLGAGWLASPWLRARPMAPLLWLLPAATAVSAAGVVAAAWANRKRAYGALARVRVVAAVVPPAVAVAAWRVAGSTPTGLVLGAVCGLAVTFLATLVALRRAGAPLPSPFPPAPARWRTTAHRYRQFPTFNLGMTLLEQVTSSLPVLVFAALFSPAAAAWFALANNVLRLPVALVGQAVAQVFYERAARARDDAAALRSLLKGTLSVLAPAAVALLVGAVLLGPLAFGWVFGRPWAQAGEYARLLAPAVALGLLTSPVSLLPAVLEKQNVHLVISFLAYGTRVGGILLGVAMGSAPLAVFFYAIGEVLVGVGFTVWLWRTVDGRARAAEEAA